MNLISFEAHLERESRAVEIMYLINSDEHTMAFSVNPEEETFSIRLQAPDDSGIEIEAYGFPMKALISAVQAYQAYQRKETK